jgi:hypothetical protein
MVSRVEYGEGSPSLLCPDLTVYPIDMPEKATGTGWKDRSCSVVQLPTLSRGIVSAGTPVPTLSPKEEEKTALSWNRPGGLGSQSGKDPRVK